MTAHLPARSRLVHDSLRAAGITGDIVVLPDAAATAPLAAAALGVEVGAIANSLVFWSDGEPLLVMTSGAHRVDTAALAARLGREQDPARDAPSRCARRRGRRSAESPRPGTRRRSRRSSTRTLAGFPEIWAAGGTPHTVFPLTFDELVRLTGGTVAKVD